MKNESWLYRMFKDIQQIPTMKDVRWRFSEEYKAINYLRSWRWANGVKCPHCGSTAYEVDQGPRIMPRYRCGRTHLDFTLKSHSIFGHSKTSIYHWIVAIFLIQRIGASQLDLMRMTGKTQKSTWRMNKFIRYILDNPSQVHHPSQSFVARAHEPDYIDSMRYVKQNMSKQYGIEIESISDELAEANCHN